MSAATGSANGDTPAPRAAAAPDGPELCAAARSRALKDFETSFTTLGPAAALAQMQASGDAQQAKLIITSGPVTAEPGDDNHGKAHRMTVMLCCNHHDCVRAGTSNAALDINS